MYRVSKMLMNDACQGGEAAREPGRSTKRTMVTVKLFHPSTIVQMKTDNHYNSVVEGVEVPKSQQHNELN